MLATVNGYRQSFNHFCFPEPIHRKGRIVPAAPCRACSPGGAGCCRTRARPSVGCCRVPSGSPQRSGSFSPDWRPSVPCRGRVKHYVATINPTKHFCFKRDLGKAEKKKSGKKWPTTGRNCKKKYWKQFKLLCAYDCMFNPTVCLRIHRFVSFKTCPIGLPSAVRFY